MLKTDLYSAIKSEDSEIQLAHGAEISALLTSSATFRFCLTGSQTERFQVNNNAMLQSIFQKK